MVLGKEGGGGISHPFIVRNNLELPPGSIRFLDMENFFYVLVHIIGPFIEIVLDLVFWQVY